ncbi:MAG TPA: hypothetical protein VGA67_00520 [Candidatus Dojkabacteria bacterium]|jgi:hypothetical protein
MDSETLRYIKDFDYRLRELERLTKEIDRQNKLLNRFLARVESKLDGYDRKSDHVINEIDYTRRIIQSSSNGEYITNP